MKNLVRIVTLFLVLSLVLVPAKATTIQAESGNKARVFVQFVPGMRGNVEKALARVGGEFHYAFDQLDTFSVSVPVAALNGLMNNPNVVMIEEDAPRFPISIEKSKIAKPASVSLPTQVVPYGIDMVQARDIWDANCDGMIDEGAVTAANRTVCVIDSGVLTDHEDLVGMNFIGGYTTIPTGVTHDMDGHGTHVAGTITAVNNAVGVVGVTPGTVGYYSVRVFGDDGNWAYASTLIDAANRCASAGANIISMSLGGSKSSRTEQKGFDKLYANGVLSIAAAGNDGTTGYSYPASYSSVMSVAAIDENKVVADFSQKNDQVEIAAPGVGVLSTIPKLDYNVLTVSGFQYFGNYIEYSARGTADGPLADGGICDTVGAWTGNIVLCQRGTNSFYEKVINAQNGGAVAAIIYNNEPGNFFGTLGDGSSSAIPAMSLSMEDGAYLVANKLGIVSNVESNLYWPVTNNYEYYDGTSMATPHVSAVAALVWAAKPTATNAEVRDALTVTAEDLGAAGKDTSYGYGLVQAKAATDYLVGEVTPPDEPPADGVLHVADLDGVYTQVRNRWYSTVTVTAVNAAGDPVANVSVSGAWSNGVTGTGICVTGSTGTCSINSGSVRTNIDSMTFTVINLAATGYTYDATANTDPDGDSDGTVIVIMR